ncbi:sugar phosphate isomerase/epimerase family protein [Pseudohoeflea coraliihabitans]|uniref:Sugar phosphate isomerase/epimerase n=1 Tax=Pseudohoeflea coraliihabitans TaxID=2860393 RepID=A0ABS6WMZ5_9HYPH|nr:sugar phosphate isomerase/epimerase [Pseudohoeflea sp. DP4N28-3]MBW3097160.1 sugar phosphate isomerase/epimerase [Pseudohoeflea sp. DP4N28-3]
MQFGMNTGFAMKRWPEPERWSDLLRHHIGADHAQLSLDMVSLEGGWLDIRRQADRIRSACRRADLPLTSVFSGLVDYSQSMLLHPDRSMREQAFERYKRAIDLTAMLEAPVFGGHMGACSTSDFGDEARRKTVRDEQIELVSKLAGIAGDCGLKQLLWEPMPVAREWPSSIEECLDYAKVFEQMAGAKLGYCLDVGHCCRPDLPEAERDPYLWIEKLAVFSPILHLQQTDGRGDRHWCFTEETKADGIISPAKVLDAIAASARQDMPQLVFEVFPPFEAEDEKVLADVTESVRYWREGTAANA